MDAKKVIATYWKEAEPPSLKDWSNCVQNAALLTKLPHHKRMSRNRLQCTGKGSESQAIYVMCWNEK